MAAALRWNSMLFRNLPDLGGSGRARDIVVEFDKPAGQLAHLIEALPRHPGLR